MTGKLAFKSLDGLIKGHIEIDAPDWGALVEAATERVLRSSVAGCWALFKEDGRQIKTGKFSGGVWRIEEPGGERGAREIREQRSARGSRRPGRSSSRVP